MPRKTKTQLSEELEESRRELKEFKDAAEAQVKALQESERRLRADLEELRALMEESRSQLQEKTYQLEDAEVQISELQNALKHGAARDEKLLSSTHVGSHVDTPTPTHEVSSVVRDVMLVRDEALEAIDRSQWELDRMRRDMQRSIEEAAESLRSAILSKESPQIPSSNKSEEDSILGGGSRERLHKHADQLMHKPASDSSPKQKDSGHSPRYESTEKPLKLPPLPTFDGANRDDVDALTRWLAKIEKHAELMRWSERTKLLQFELHLSGRAEQVYELLPSSVRDNFEKATQGLRERLYPVENEALISAQLMRRKQLGNESVDEFAQEMEQLFERSYGRRRGMDDSSKALLKRDVFVQGLLLKWQKKVLPSASTYSDALHQARAAEQQERQLSKLHPTPKSFHKGKPTPDSRPTVPEPKSPDPASKVPDSDPKDATPRVPPRGRGGPMKCFECGSTSHKWRDCPLRKPTETPGKPRDASNSAITVTSESVDDRCDRLRQEWISAEFTRMSNAYEANAMVDQVVGAVGPLCYTTVEIAGQSVEAMVDTGSSATILSFETFQKIGKRAKIPVSALSKPDVVLRDFNRHPIPVGAKVDLNFRFHGKSVVAPVYIRAKGPKGTNTEIDMCLLGTNVIFALGIMEPAEGVQKRIDESPTTGTVCLARSTKIPARIGAYLEVRPNSPIATDTLMFVPNRDWSASVGLEVEDSILQATSDGSIKIPVLNTTNVAVCCTAGLQVGQVTVLPTDPIVPTVCEGANTDLKVTYVQPSRLSPDRQQQLMSSLDVDRDLEEEAAERLMQCAIQHHEVFAVNDGELGEVSGIEHEIHTGDSQPIRQVPRRVPFAVRNEMTQLVQEMLNDEVIQESASPWASPVVLVRKKDGSLRFCVDYRRLNAVTHKDTFPLPRIDDLLDQMNGKKIFSTLDAKRGYWQIKVQESSREKTAFVTFDGLYEFKVMPFGLCNAPSTFQRLMQKILRGFDSFCSVYIDDILVYSESVEEHLSHLSQVFARIESFGLKLHPGKCRLGYSEVLFLGHVVSAEGIKPDPSKVRAVEHFPVPTNVRSVREFVGLASYYRRFVPNFARVAGPLHNLTRSDVPFVWTESCQKAFDCIKKLLTTPPVLSYPDFTQPFELHTDASGAGLGAVLEQKSQGVNHPVAYASRTLSRHEQRYGITELETLGVVWGLRHFRAYLYGHKVTVFTDHAPVKAMLKTRQPSGKLARWAESVAEFDVEIVYKPGRVNANADALSRSPLGDPIATEEVIESQVAAVSTRAMERQRTEELEETRDLSQLQMEDPYFGALIQFHASRQLPTNQGLAKRVLSDQSRFVVVDKVLYRVDAKREGRLRLCVPLSRRQSLMVEAHSGKFSGHFSPKAVYGLLSKRYWWDGMYSDVHAHCRSCLTCATYQGTGRRAKQPLLSIPVGGAFHRVGVDIMELPLTVNGNRYVITFIDYLTKWVESFACSNQTSDTIAKLLIDHIVCRHGVPEILVSDRGANLLSSVMQEVYEVTGIQKRSTTAYHPQADGLVENFNRTLRAMVAKHAEKFGVNWDEHLPYLLFAYRTKPHDSTGESPFFLLYGRDARLPCEDVFMTERTPYQVDLDDYKTELTVGLAEAWKTAQDHLKIAQKRQKRHYDRHARERKIRVGDRVMVLMPAEKTGKNRKLLRPYFGPYRVLDTHPNGISVVPVDRPKDPSIRVNLDRVTLCYPELPDVSYTGRKPRRAKNT